MKKYEITEEAILAGVKQCPDAENVLKAMFPEAFKKKGFDLFKLSTEDLNSHQLFNDESSQAAGFEDSNFMQVRGSIEFTGIAFFLHSDYNWILKRDSGDELCLIPSEK